MTLVLAALTLASMLACDRDPGADSERILSQRPIRSPTVAPTPTPASSVIPTPTETTENEPIDVEVIIKYGTTDCVYGDGGSAGWQFESFLKWSPDGSRILFDVRRGYGWGGMALYAVDTDGTSLQEVAAPSYYEDPVWGSIGPGPMIYFDVSADGSRLAFSRCDHPGLLGDDRSEFDRDDYDYEIVVSNIDGTEAERLTENRGFDNYPVWSPDGSRIAYISSPQLVIVDMATREKSNNVIKPTDTHRIGAHPPAWSPNGSRMAVMTWEWGNWQGNFNVFVMDVEGPEQKRISETLARPAWSPDGERIAVLVPEEGDEAALYTFGADGADPVRVAGLGPMELRSPEGIIGSLSWSPDGSKVLLDGPVVHVIAADGSGVTRGMPLDVPDDYEWIRSDYRFYFAVLSPLGPRMAPGSPCGLHCGARGPKLMAGTRSATSISTR